MEQLFENRENAPGPGCLCQGPQTCHLTKFLRVPSADLLTNLTNLTELHSIKEPIFKKTGYVHLQMVQS